MELDDFKQTARGLALDMVKDEVVHLELEAEGVANLSLDVAFDGLSDSDANTLSVAIGGALRSMVIVMLDRWSAERGVTMGALWAEVSEILVDLFEHDGTDEG